MSQCGDAPSFGWQNITYSVFGWRLVRFTFRVGENSFLWFGWVCRKYIVIINVIFCAVMETPLCVRLCVLPSVSQCAVGGNDSVVVEKSVQALQASHWGELLLQRVPGPAHEPGATHWYKHVSFRQVKLFTYTQTHIRAHLLPSSERE